MPDIVLRTTEDLVNIINGFIEGDQYSGNIKFEESLLTLNYHFTGSKYNSTLTPTMMKSLIGLQDIINDIYLNCIADTKRIRLKDEEKKQLEITYTVTDGSTKILASFAEAIENLELLLKGLDSKQKTKIVMALIAVFSIKSVADIASDAYLKAKQVEIENKKIELENKKEEHDFIEKMELLQMTQSAIAVATENRDKSIRLLAKENFDTVVIDDVSFDHEVLNERVKIERPRVETERKPLESNFIINSIDLTNPEIIYIDITDEVTGIQYHKVDIFTGFISKDDYSMIEQAMKRETIRMRLVLEIKKGKVLAAFLQSIVKDL
ncbi:hypothetical protein K7J14_02470 [Treponema zuelzerae]|uniref:Uncharacterized protein n=1 Tax=Teretinema zuelzerae TaxID=156 RepID=A0AAE3JHC1_9SPIR|nr:hypothetical protein [Teretinema zuelzerae]MCD1653562.1 hypothetical protein [Teretinema zuelzerae]